MTGEAVLKIEKLSFAYEKTNVLKDITFEGNLGEILVIAGPNGSGKTTLIKLMFDLLNRKKGEILVKNESSCNIAAKNQMFYLSSENILPAFLSGDEYVRMMCRLYDVTVDEKLYERLIQYYAMEHRIQNLIENYSHGMVKKIQLITAFLLQRDITVVDETLNGIDIEAKEASKILLRKLAEKGKLVMICTHDLELAEQIGDRAVLLYKGMMKSILDMRKEKVSLTEVFKQLVGFRESDYEI